MKSGEVCQHENLGSVLEGPMNTRISIYLTTATSPHLSYERVLASAQCEGVRHHLSAHPDEADIILFAENYMGDSLQLQVRRHPLYRKYRNKCFVLFENDSITPVVPGVYACVPRRFYRPSKTRTGPYVWMLRDLTIDPTAISGTEPFLFSFVGSSHTHHTRQAVLKLQHERAWLQDTHSERAFGEHSADPQAQRMYHLNYDQAIRNSKFVLCPRGMACASVRFFEAMRAGRAPVLISDDYVYPEGIDFGEFVVRVRESEVLSIPRLLESLEDETADRGRLARQAFDSIWSGPSLFNYLGDCCLSLAESRHSSSRLIDHWWVIRQTLSPEYFGNFQRRIRGQWRVESWHPFRGKT